MTAESLKHFIALPSEAKYRQSRRKYSPTLICFGVLLAVLGGALLGLTIYNSIRATHMQDEIEKLHKLIVYEAFESSRSNNLKEEVEKLQKLVETLQKRLGGDIFHDLDEFEEDYNKQRGDFFDDEDVPYDSLELDNEDEFDDEKLDDFEDEEDKTLPKHEFGNDHDKHRVNVNQNHDGDNMKDDADFDAADYGLEAEQQELPGSGSYEDYEEYRDMEPQFLSKKESKRTPRAIPTTSSGIPVFEESYAHHRKNKSRADEYLNSMLLRRKKMNKPTMKYEWNQQSPKLSHESESNFAESRAQPESFVRAPAHLRPRPAQLREMHQARERYQRNFVNARPGRVMFVKGPMSQNIRRGQSYPGQVVLTNTKRRNIRPMQKSMDGRQRQGMSRHRTIAVHYIGDTSQYTPGRHEHYEGNGRLRHMGGTYVDWTADNWVGNLNMERFFRMENGVVSVRENGLYYIYAQIFYHDDHDVNGFVVERNRQPFLQCTTMTHTSSRVTKSNSCLTSGVTFLKNGDSISVSDLGSHRYTILEPSKSFFGLIKIADARTGQPHLPAPAHPTQNDMPVETPRID